MTSSPEPRLTAAMAELGRWSDALPEYDLAAGAARHAELLRTGAPAPLLREASLLSRTAWWITGSVAVVALGIAVVGRDMPDEDSAVAEVSAPATTVAPSTRALAVPAPTPTRPHAPASSPASEHEPATPPRRAAPRSRASEAAVVANAPDRLERELALVRRMRAAAPAQVLELARTADREVGEGVLGEERAALEVLALAEQDDPSARTRARAFLRDHPGSPFAAKLERIAAP